jgi:hypothetical protein
MKSFDPEKVVIHEKEEAPEDINFPADTTQ